MWAARFSRSASHYLAGIGMSDSSQFLQSSARLEWAGFMLLW
jgi:hypothetical protein